MTADGASFTLDTRPRPARSPAVKTRKQPSLVGKRVYVTLVTYQPLTETETEGRRRFEKLKRNAELQAALGGSSRKPVLRFIRCEIMQVLATHQPK